MVCVGEFDPPTRISLTAEYEAGRQIVKIERFSAPISYNEKDIGECFRDDFEIWMMLEQGDFDSKIGEIDLDTEFLIEDWDGSPRDDRMPVETDSSQIVNSDFTDRRSGVVPGTATLYVRGRGEDVRVFATEVELVAEFPTADDIHPREAALTEDGSSFGFTYNIVSPVPYGVPVEVRETLTDQTTGETVATNTRSKSVSGVLLPPGTNTEEMSHTFDVTPEGGHDYKACAELTSIDGDPVSQ